MSFSATHRLRVKSLYKRYLKNSLDWTIRRDIWRERAIEIRAAFERNRNVRDPRALEALMERSEMQLEELRHPDPFIWPKFPGGSKWERNLPPPMEPIVDHKAHH